MDWIDLAQDRNHWIDLVNAVMNFRLPQNAGKFLSSCTTCGLSRRAQFHGVSSIFITMSCFSYRDHLQVNSNHTLTVAC
jgi:hypothetical protein